MREISAPIRLCVGCRRRRAAAELTRVALTASGTLVLSAGASGRGAWLCRSAAVDALAVECLEIAASRRAFDRAFRRTVETQAVEDLRASAQEHARMEGAELLSGTGAQLRRD